MLNQEQATERLEKIRDKRWVDLRLRSIKKLPKRLQSTSRCLMGVGDDGKPFEPYTMEGEKLQQEMMATLQAMTPAQRKQLLGTLFPKMQKVVEAAWELHKQLPYQIGWTKRAFRAPSRPDAVSDRQIQWLSQLVQILAGYPDDIAWIAAWASHLDQWGSGDVLGILLAAAINRGGREADEVVEILKESATNEHEVGMMGRHVTRALLCASREDGWEFVEKMLLAAQRQEGLRQVILETIDEAHPDAFRRMLGVILEHNLGRFSATVRAMDVWFGFMWDSASAGVVKKVLEEVIRYLDDAGAREEALASGEAESAYLALWTIAFEDGFAAIEPAQRLLSDKDVERRFVGAHLLATLMTCEAKQTLFPALADDDLRVAVRALNGIAEGSYYSDHMRESEKTEEQISLESSDLFERLQVEVERFPKKAKQKPIVWPWMVLTAERQQVAAAMVQFLGGRNKTKLIDYIPMMDAPQRGWVVERLAADKKWDTRTRDTLFSLVGDASGTVREAALKALKKCTITAKEAQHLEGLLTRKANDLRRGVLTLLSKQADDDTLISADRLLSASNAQQRIAGIEVLRGLIEADRQADACRSRVRNYQESRKRITKEEQTQIETILDTGREVPTLDDALGLMDPAARTAPPVPQKKKVNCMTKAALACLESLHDLIESHQETSVKVQTWEGETEMLLGNIGWQFPHPEHDKPIDEQMEKLPLAAVWEDWYATRSKKLKDADGLELMRASMRLHLQRESWYGKNSPVMADVLKSMIGQTSLRMFKANDRQVTVDRILTWLICLHPTPDTVSFLLDGFENGLAIVADEIARNQSKGLLGKIIKRTQQLLTIEVEEDEADPEKPFRPARLGAEWREHHSPLIQWLSQVRSHRASVSGDWTDEEHVRLWQLVRWLDEPGLHIGRMRTEFEETVTAFRHTAANEHDLYDHFLGPRPKTQYGWGSFDELRMLSAKRIPDQFKGLAFLPDIVQRCRERVLDVELVRGEEPTAATEPAMALRSAGGLEVLLRILESMGKAKFTRGYSWGGNQSKATVFSHLVRVSRPAEQDTPSEFAKQMKSAGIDESRLLDLAVYAPQWAEHVEHTLKWRGLEEAVWWIHAHTKDDQWSVDQEIRESWNAAVSQRTPLSGEDLMAGGVDVAWFHRVYGSLKKARWEKLNESAKYASGGGGHKRAQLFGEAMRGTLQFKKQLIERIDKKRYQDAVRALGLVPLSKGRARERDLLQRYQAMQEFLRTSRQFGSQRQASEKRAATIGMENLARTAGYPDPIRLQWAMEAKETADLAHGPVVVSAGNVDVALAIDSDGNPELTITKNGKQLKSIPAAVKKDKKVIALRDRRTALKRQASRMRKSLEQAMCRGDCFTGGELKELFEHPVLRPMLSRLILVGEGIIGYPVKNGQALEDQTGKLEPIKKNEQLRIAHPHDLLPARTWSAWQHDCFQRERVQPFKQVFRELYVVSSAEKKEKNVSRRYAGHQVHPRQATALLGSRGWVVAPEEGVCRTFHEEKLTAWIEFQEPFFTPADIEGLTLEGVRFARREESGHEVEPLTKVPPRIFSEVMRDLDLVVSVAHRGGVDPEASASTVEMRSTLLKETLSLLEIKNVRIKDSHALIKGELGAYTIHLGSAVAHRQPGGALFIVAVHSQHRGRLFLPFADDDPKTAEVLSLVIMLARDKDIQDPSILEQIRSGG